MQASSFRYLCVAILLATLAACNARPSHEIAHRTAAVNHLAEAAFGLPEAVTAVVMRTGFDMTFADLRKISLDALAEPELASLFDATSTAAFYTTRDRDIDNMLWVLAALERRHLGTEDQLDRAYRELVTGRRFAEANELATRHPSPERAALPAVTSSEPPTGRQPTELALDLASHELVRRAVQLDPSVQILAVGQPSCHFSQNATKAIEADPELQGIFLKHAKWISPASSPLDWPTFQTWNQGHPGQEMTLAYRNDEWPMVTHWGTPTFYFLKDGVVQTTVRGWPRGGRAKALRDAMHQVGLL